jgi:hypothetical protein
MATKATVMPATASRENAVSVYPRRHSSDRGIHAPFTSASQT